MYNSNEMELMLKSGSQKAYGLEDRGYYQLELEERLETTLYYIAEMGKDIPSLMKLQL